MWCARRRRSGRTSSTCSSRRIIPTTFQYPGGPPLAAVRQRRVDRGVSDGAQVRSRARRVRGDNPAAHGCDQAAGGIGHRGGERGRLCRVASDERCGDCRQPFAEGGRRSLLGSRSHVAIAERHRRDLHRRETLDASDSQDSGFGAGTLLCGRHDASAVRNAAIAARAHRLVGSIRRLDAVRARALAARAVRVPIRGRLSSDARCRQSQGEVRCAAVSRWRHSGERIWRRRLSALSRERKTSRPSIDRTLVASH